MMTIPLWCLFAATLWVVLSKAPMNILIARSKAYDNHHPRLQQQQLQPGAVHRAWAAHQNMIEAYPMFAVAVLVAQWLGGASALVSVLCLSYLALRLLYQLCYLMDWATPRSISWGLSYFCVLGLLLTPLLEKSSF
ncbi:MAG: MAPEG family protein [Halopseudomonas sp.]